MTKKYTIPQEAQNEISRFKSSIIDLEADKLEEDSFKRFRLNNGIYGIRGKHDEHMIRIKLPFGYLDADQLEVIACIAEKYTPTKLSHVTTRQAIQLHNFKRSDIVAILTEIAEAGMTSREACGNTVRNLTSDELAGVHPDELFDINPYADLLYRYFLRNPICQNLPRKFKIAFEGCPDSDRARIGIHDLGFRATSRVVNGQTEYGFISTVGGGLGSMPFAAYLLEEFVPFDEYLATAEAIIHIFDRHGNRRDKNRARIKFVIKEWGIDEFRKRFIAEKKAVMATRTGRHENYVLNWPEEVAPESIGAIDATPVDQVAFDNWKTSNVIAQKQSGFNAVYVRCLYGDLTPEEARGAAQISREYGGGRLRTTITQNIIMRWIPDAAIKTVFNRLAKIGLAEANAQQLADITRCPGADTCNLAITHSKGLARDLTEKVFSNGLASDKELQHISIKISGCTNSCGQHHIGNIGFYGASRNVEGKQLPHYQMLLGGRTGIKHEDVQFGQRIAMIPARRISEAVKHLLSVYKNEKKSGETFIQWCDQVNKDYLIEIMQPYTEIDSLKADPSTMYEDLGDVVGSQFKVSVGKGECAA